MKYGFRDYRGGGRYSGRETLGRVAAGAIAVKILDQLGIRLMTYSKSIGPIACDPRHFDAEEILKNPVYMPDADAAENAMAYLEACIAEQNSSGGVVECIISGVPAGIGDPVFEKLNANLAKAVMSIGAVIGFVIGDGFDVAKATGKIIIDENNWWQDFLNPVTFGLFFPTGARFTIEAADDSVAHAGYAPELYPVPVE